MFSYGIVYPKNFDNLDLKNLDKYLPKLESGLKKSVDKLMKRNKYGELESVRQLHKFTALGYYKL